LYFFVEGFYFMVGLVDVLNELNSVGSDSLGAVNKIDESRWIIGGEDDFPIQIELLEGDGSFLIYGTGIRATSAPVFAPIMVTLFVEGLHGHSLGKYGICPGPVTVTIYQKLTWHPEYTPQRLAAEITCHRMLTECFLEGVLIESDDHQVSLQDLHDNQPMLPLRH
jgi:hypothetical protein